MQLADERQAARELRDAHCACPGSTHSTQTVETCHNHFLFHGPIQRPVWIVFAVEVDEDIIPVSFELLLSILRFRGGALWCAHGFNPVVGCLGRRKLGVGKRCLNDEVVGMKVRNSAFSGLALRIVNGREPYKDA